jgi:hypothetical protein
MAPINKDHDAEYWRKEYERLRSALHSILKLTKDEDLTSDDVKHDVEITAYRHLYEE